MAGEIFEGFNGIAPKINPKRLSESLAQTAKNCILDQAVLGPMPTTATTADTVNFDSVSIYKYDANTWIGNNRDRDFARVPVANDTLERIVITDELNYPYVYSAGASYRLGIPAPTSALTPTPTEAPEDPNGVDAETISYVVTFVDAWGAEGPPSIPSASVDRVRDTQVDLTNLPQPPAGNYNWGSGAVKRIYRSNTGTAGANYQYVDQVDIAAASYTDNIDNGDLGELMPSLTWIGPPDDDTALYPAGPMVGVLELPNGVLAGFSGRTLCFSEPYLYHAWPLEYRVTFNEDIVSIVSITSGLLVTTVEKPYMVTGVSPAAMAVTDMDVKQACVSKKGTVDMGKYAIYPSPDGLVLVEGNSATLITESMFTREQWQTRYDPTTIHAYQWEGKYIAFYGDPGVGGFVFDPRGGANAFVEIDDWYDAGYYSAIDDTLFLSDGGNIIKWAQGNGYTSYTWKSRRSVLAKPVCFGFIRVVAVDSLATNNVTVKIWADGDLKITVVLNDDDNPWAALPSGFRAKEWEIEITGINPISHIGLFESLTEAV